MPAPLGAFPCAPGALAAPLPPGRGRAPLPAAAGALVAGLAPSSALSCAGASRCSPRVRVFTVCFLTLISGVTALCLGEVAEHDGSLPEVTEAVFNVLQRDPSQRLLVNTRKESPVQFGDERAVRSISSDMTFQASVSL